MRRAALPVACLAALIGGGVVAAHAQWRAWIPRVPWGSTAVIAAERSPLLVESPDRSFLDLELHWRGSLMAGESWLPSKRRRRLDPWSIEHWVGDNPSLYFVPPAGGDLELAIVLGRITGGPAAAEAVLDGRTLCRLPVSRHGAELRVTLPQSRLVAGINNFRLRFEGTDPATDRDDGATPPPGTATVRSVTLVGGAQRPSSFADGRLRLEAGSPLRIPYSAASPRRLVLSVARASAGAVLHVVQIEAGGRRRELWRGPIARAQRLELESPRLGWGRLELLLAGPGSASAELGCSLEAEPEPAPGSAAVAGADGNVFLFVVDTLRADAVDLAGEADSATPHMARFAADSVVFERAWSPSSWTRPSTEALLGGTYPVSSTPPAWRLPAELEAAGYDTVAVSQSYVVSRRHFGAGFASFFTTDALSRGTNEGHTVPWFLWHHLVARQTPERPLFAYLHIVDPHGPYTPFADDRRHMPWWLGWRVHRFGPPTVEQERREGDPDTVSTMRSLYAGDVRHADRAFGSFLALLRFMGLYDDSLIILCSDHGEAFAEHGRVGHGKSLYEEELRVPLLVKLPRGEGAGRVIRRPVSTVAVAPTILRTLGRTPPDHLSAPSLLAPGDHDEPLRARLMRRSRALAERQSFDAVRVGDLKCIWTSAPSTGERLEAFDLARDPAEAHPLTAETVRERCRELLGPPPGDDVRDEASFEGEPEATRRRLEALGYLDVS